MFNFTVDYYLFALIASLGVLQVAASLGNLRGLLVFKSPVLARTLGLMAPIAAFIWFFTSETRNLNDYEGGLDGNYQALLFLLGAVSATIITALLTSIVNARLAGREPEPGEGLEALAHNSYAKAVRHSLRYWWRNWRTQTKSYFSG